MRIQRLALLTMLACTGCAYASDSSQQNTMSPGDKMKYLTTQSEYQQSILGLRSNMLLALSEAREVGDMQASSRLSECIDILYLPSEEDFKDDYFNHSMAKTNQKFNVCTKSYKSWSPK